MQRDVLLMLGAWLAMATLGPLARAQIITTYAGTGVAGTGPAGQTGDNGQATQAEIIGPFGLALDKAGNLYMAASTALRKVSPSGIITTVAGNGKVPGQGCLDGVVATSVPLTGLTRVALDSVGNLYLVLTPCVEKLGPDGILRKIAGPGGVGTCTSGGDGGPGTWANLDEAMDVAIDAADNIYIADSPCNSVRKIDTNGNVSTVTYLNPGGSPAFSTYFDNPNALAVDSSGTLYVSENTGSRLCKVTPGGTKTYITGASSANWNGEGGPASQAFLNCPWGLTVDSAGNLYSAETGDSKVHRIGTDGILYSVAGNGTNGYSGDGGPATSAQLNAPEGVAVDGAGNVYIADTGNNLVRVVRPAAGPVITAVENAASFQPGLAASTWITIKGSGLSSATDTWANAVVGGNLPTMLDGVSVSVGGQPAYISYVGSGQINALAPNVGPGTVSVTVTNAGGTSPAVSAAALAVQPAFFPWGNYVVATHQDYSFAVKNGAISGLTTVPAKPGEMIILWGTGFGPTNPVAPVGVAVPSGTVYCTANPVTVTVGGVAATVYGGCAALTPGNAGLYQLAIQVPASLADGDYAVIATVAGAQSPSTALITVQK
jgi:uncharacterized protein (TIGR03437 family)